MTDFLHSLDERRKLRFMPYHGVGVRTPEEAVEFFNEAGFCLLSYIPGVELPNLSKAVCPDEQVDIWGWKDSLPANRQVFYGSIFHPVKEWGARPGFVSLEMLAPLYSLAPVLQFGGDLPTLRRYVKISQEAIMISDALEREGSLSTKELRAATNMTSKANATKFSRGLAEAQAHFLITKIGVTSTTRANYGYIWNTFGRTFPQIAQDAEVLKESDAASMLIYKYVQTAIGVPLARIARMLTLNLRNLEPAAQALIKQGKLYEVEIEDGERYLTANVHE